jgi:uncharacterized membrane protein (UPF0127 family)
MPASERSRESRAPARTLSVLSRDRGALVCERCEVADRPLTRLRGLLGRPGLEPDSGLLIEPCNSIHTCFMRFAIDAVFLDSELRVLRVRSRMRPWRVAGAHGARAVLELAAGEAERCGLSPGEGLYLTPVPAAVAAATGARRDKGGASTGVSAIMGGM